MLLYKLKEIETQLEDSPTEDVELLEAARTLKRLLLQIDYRAEVFPNYSLTKLYPLLEDFLGRDLNDREHEVIVKVLLNF